MDEIQRKQTQSALEEKTKKTPFIESVRQNMKKIRSYEEMEWTTGDYFKFEQHDFNWFMEKMAGARDSNYKGC